MKLKFDKTTFLDSLFAIIKMVLISIVTSLVLVLVVALIAKYCSLDNAVVIALNYVIKVVSVLIGAIFGVGNKPRGPVNGGIGGFVYMLLAFLLFSGLNGGIDGSKFSWIDMICLTLAGVISGIISVNIKRKVKK